MANTLPDRWTTEDIQFLLWSLEEVGGRGIAGILVADSALGIPTIHGIRGADHLGFGYFEAKTPEYTVNFDAGGAMSRTPSGMGWTYLRVTKGSYPYDLDGVRQTLMGYLDVDAAIDRMRTVSSGNF